MAEPNLNFHGWIGRAEGSADKILCRIYPFTFNNDPTAAVVFEIIFDQPQFILAELSRLAGVEEELAVTLRENTAKFEYYWEDLEYEFKAKKIEAKLIPYDLDDYVSQVSLLQGRLQDSETENTNLTLRLTKSMDLIPELIRRAEIKGTVSDEMQRRQSAVIDALTRLYRELSRED